MLSYLSDHYILMFYAVLGHTNMYTRAETREMSYMSSQFNYSHTAAGLIFNLNFKDSIITHKISQFIKMTHS